MGYPPKPIEEAPMEVMQAYVLKGQMVGLELYNKIQATIDKYPEWFPWEHKYRSIPQSVHDAFKAEAYPPQPALTKEDFEYKPVTLKPITEDDFVAFLKSVDQREREKAEREKELRKIWNKHYGKYNLDYYG